MKKFCILALLLLCTLAPAQEARAFSLHALIPHGSGPEEIPFYYNFPGDMSPYSFALKDGARSLINCSGFFLVYDIIQKKAVGRIFYPPPPSDAYYIYQFFQAIFNLYATDSGFVSSRNNVICAIFNKEGTAIESYSVKMDFKAQDSRDQFRQVGSLVIAQAKDNSPAALLPTGEFVNHLEEFGYERVAAPLFHRLPETAKRLWPQRCSGFFLVVDGLFYPSTFAELTTYFSKLGMSVELTLPFGNPGHGIEPYGQSYYGDMYFSDYKNICVIDQCGKLLAVLDLPSINPDKSDGPPPEGQSWPNSHGPIVSIHPNGDVYALTALEGDCTRIWKIERDWGIDCIGMARRGLAERPSKEELALLESLSAQELKIIRNALFAFRGYAFKNIELRNFFQGYEWYKPDPAVKSDAALLAPHEKRLFERVAAIEAARKLP